MSVPAERVTAERLVTLAVPTTGTVLVPTARASVTVTVTNPRSEDVSLPAGTVVTTSGGCQVPA